MTELRTEIHQRSMSMRRLVDPVWLGWDETQRAEDRPEVVSTVTTGKPMLFTSKCRCQLCCGVAAGIHHSATMAPVRRFARIRS